MSFFYKKNEQLEALINKYFEMLSEYNEKHFSGKLSVILLGSLSRGEATWCETDAGPQLLSDIEYFTVYPSGFDAFSEFKKYSDDLATKLFALQGSSLFHIDNTFVCRERLAHMERKLLTYDALQMGKCMFGEDDISKLPDINISNINLFDIKDVLTHRVFSVLYYGFPLKESGKTDEYRYSLAKNSLDLMTVLLVSYGILASGFQSRLKLIRQLNIDEKLKDYFSFCLSIKLSEKTELDFSIGEMEQMFISTVKLLYSRLRIPLKNVILNTKHISRRFLGMLKRMLKYHHIPYFSHLKSLIISFEKNEKLSSRQLKSNLVINGYPQ